MSTPLLVVLSIGAYLLWYGIKHFGSTDVFGPLKSMLQGNGLK
jgi:hypothetical protein